MSQYDPERAHCHASQSPAMSCGPMACDVVICSEGAIASSSSMMLMATGEAVCVGVWARCCVPFMAHPVRNTGVMRSETSLMVGCGMLPESEEKSPRSCEMSNARWDHGRLRKKYEINQ